MIKIMKKSFIGITYFFFWILAWFITTYTTDWVKLPSFETSAPSQRAIALGALVTLVTSIILGSLFCLIIKKLNSSDKTKRSWSFWINIIIMILMFISILLSTFNYSPFSSIFMEVLGSWFILIVCIFTVILGIFDFYKLLRTWNNWWYYYGITLQTLALTMLMIGLSYPC